MVRCLFGSWKLPTDTQTLTQNRNCTVRNDCVGVHGADEPVTATMCIKRFLQVYPKTRNVFCASLHCIVFSFHSGKLLITIVRENKSNPFPFLAIFCRLYLTQTYLLLTLLLCCTGSCIVFVLQLIDTDTLRTFCIAPSFPPNLLSPFPDLPSLALIVTLALASVFSPFSLECHTNTNISPTHRID